MWEVEAQTLDLFADFYFLSFFIGFKECLRDFCFWEWDLDFIHCFNDISIFESAYFQSESADFSHRCKGEVLTFLPKEPDLCFLFDLFLRFLEVSG